jgi:hypothetical protein
MPAMKPPTVHQSKSVAVGLEIFSPQEQLETCRYLNLTLEADDGAIVGVDANFDLAGLGELGGDLETCWLC